MELIPVFRHLNVLRSTGLKLQIYQKFLMARHKSNFNHSCMPHRVLVVDDHAVIRNILTSKFTVQGFDVRKASNGAGGISGAEEVHPV
jgi:PleD family two-component response regulator